MHIMASFVVSVPYPLLLEILLPHHAALDTRARPSHTHLIGPDPESDARSRSLLLPDVPN